MSLRDFLEKHLRYTYSIWKYSEGEKTAELLEEGLYAFKRTAFKVAREIRAMCVRETDRIVVRRIPVESRQKFNKDGGLTIDEWEISINKKGGKK